MKDVPVLYNHDHTKSIGYVSTIRKIDDMLALCIIIDIKSLRELGYIGTDEEIKAIFLNRIQKLIIQGL
jgi:hypothetical protein